MQFKVGDRVEAIKPPINMEKSDPDEVGIGVIKEVNPRPFDGAYLVKLDSGPEWAYWESYLRPAPTATLTPSITVGTQVRLTGVVKDMDSVGAWIDFPGRDRPQTVKVPFDALEVIRQPFKRGEVVYCGTGSDMSVVADETSEGVLVAAPEPGATVYLVDATQFERRP